MQGAGCRVQGPGCKVRAGSRVQGGEPGEAGAPEAGRSPQDEARDRPDAPPSN